MPPPPPSERASFLLMEECFAQQDAGFIEALRRIESPKVLAAFADRWKKDPRPWARAQIFAYLEYPLDCVGHQPIVKRLYKDAEARQDHELVAAFVTAFDTLVRRRREKRWHWDQATRSSFEEEYLNTPRDVLPAEVRRSYVDIKSGERVVISMKGYRIMRGRLFTHRTRHYLRRRAWRYFRWLGYRDPAAYPRAIAGALQRYRDADLAKGENILDSWALLNICFRGTDVVEFRPSHLRLKDGKSLADLHAAPRFPRAWETADGARVLLELIARARAHLVRMWAMELFRSVRGKVTLELGIEEVFALLDHADERVQQFGAELFAAHPGLDKLPVATWLRLLESRNLTTLATIATAFSKHVSPERLTLGENVALACAQPVPVARLGQSLLAARSVAASDYPVLGALAEAKCPAVAGELASWTLAQIGASPHYDVNTVARFFDSLTAETRVAAWTWLIAGGPSSASAGYNDPLLWSRLAETPFDDLRLLLVDRLALRVKTPELSPDQLAPVWSAVLLGVHRGGRQKLKAVREIAEAVAGAPGSAPQLLPVLAVAVRSVRGPEMRAGLAAVMTLLAARPELEPAVRARLPELQFPTGGINA